VQVSADTQLLEVEPGTRASVVVEVVNTGAVIDGVTARVIGLPEESVRSDPPLLPLFPEATGLLTLDLAVPSTYPAGRHPLTVEVMSHGAKVATQFIDLSLEVAPRPGMSMAATPRVVRARRQGKFVLQLVNTGNLPLAVQLRGVDVDRTVQARFTPEQLTLAAGATVAVLATIRGPRMLFGAEIERIVTVEATARRADQPGDDEAPVPIESTHEIPLRLKQRPVVSRGPLTALILASIVALWALVFLFGLDHVFASDPMTKAVPASFFAAGTGSGGASDSSISPAALTTGGAPAGALPKNGQMPPGLGGSITGTVTAASDHEPVGRILVEALRQGANGPVVVSSAATQTDGTYTLAGLFPTGYYVRFSAAGYTPVYYPAAADQSSGQLVTATAQGTTDGVDAVITGLPASVSGSIDPGDSLTPVPTTVIARPLASASSAPAAKTVTAADGSYTLQNLPAPGTYELSFTATGYQTTTIVDTVSGGQQRLEPTVQLAVGVGQISGTVTDGTAPLGGVTVSTTVGGQALTLTTPTTGTVGVFVLGNLPTPATYVLTFTKAGYGAQTMVIDLTAGENRPGLTVPLASGTGSVTGTLVDSAGQGLGGATVTVGGSTVVGGTGATAPSTTTLTSGLVGGFVVNGLTAPGSYTLTFTLAGYAPTTVPVTLSGTGAPAKLAVTLSTQLGQVKGQITGPGGIGYIGATITATDGVHTFTSTSTGASSGLPQGGYVIAGLQPGTYTLTATAPSLSPQTALITITAGKTTTQSLALVS
jgi:hypothetical protein